MKLMGQTEVAKRLEWSLQHVRIYRLRAESKDFPAGGFPKPIQQLACGHIWLAEDIEKYAAEREAKASQKLSVHKRVIDLNNKYLKGANQNE